VVNVWEDEFQEDYQEEEGDEEQGEESGKFVLLSRVVLLSLLLSFAEWLVFSTKRKSL